jgi:hypothetical protein
VIGQIRPATRIVTPLSFPDDDPVFDVHIPGAGSGAIDPVGGADLLVILPSFAVEILPLPLATTDLGPTAGYGFFLTPVSRSKKAER